MRKIGAIDIGGTKIAAGIVREDGSILHRAECPTNAGRGFPDAVLRMQRMLREAIDRCGPIAGIGVACPGPLDPLTGIIGDVGTLPGWQGSDLPAAIGAHFGLSTVVENDADAATLAEYSWGSTRTAGTLMYITISTGIGGGLVQDGRLYRGVRGSHPEFGHQVIDPSGPLCYCTLSGCWESLASGSAMSALFPQQETGNAPLTAAQICDRARQGDVLAMRAVKREAHYLGLGLANLVTLFSPDVVCLGGGVMKSSDLFLDDVESMVRSVCTQVPVEYTTIATSSLTTDLGLLGAAQSWLLRNP